MRTIHYLLLLLIVFSCKKEENIDSSQNVFSGSPDLITQTEDLNIVTCVGHGSLWNFSILKTDTIGNKIWEKQFSYDDELHLKRIMPLNESEFLIAMNQREHLTIGVNDYVRLLIIESNGNIKWEKEIDFEEDIEFKDICMLPNNNFILCGDFVSYSKFYYCEIDKNLNQNWIKTYTDSIEYCQARQVMFEDDSINILGSINANRVLLLRTDMNGNISSKKEFQINTHQFYFSEISTELILVENSKSGSLSFYKVNNQGNSIWQNTYTIPDCDNAVFSDLKISNNSYCILGNKSFSGIGEPKITKNFIIKTLFNGDELWQKTIKDDEDIIRCIDILEGESIISAVSNNTYEKSSGLTFYLEIIKN